MGRLIKFGVYGIIALVLLAVFSTPALRSMEQYARDRKDTSLGQSLPYTLGGIAYLTFRYSLAKDIYEKNLDMWPDHPKRADAYYRIAQCDEKLGNYSQAVAEFDQFALEFPTDNRAENARRRSSSIKAVQLDNPFGD